MDTVFRKIRIALLPPLLLCALLVTGATAGQAGKATDLDPAVRGAVSAAEPLATAIVPTRACPTHVHAGRGALVSALSAHIPLPRGARELEILVDGAPLPGPCYSVPGQDGTTRHLAPAAQFVAAMDDSFWAGEKEGLDLTGLLWADGRYLSVEEACAAWGIALYQAPEDDRLWCTSAAGDWSVPEGIEVPVLLYHGVGDDLRPGAELVVRTEELEAQLQLLLERGYTPIWLEDLKHADEIQKPVILTFDDGYRDNYTELFPLLQRYGVKATLFVVPGYLGNECNLSEAQIREMLASGLVSIQCHTWYHLDLDTLSCEEQVQQLCWSRVMLLQLTDRLPYAIAYPRGRQNEETLSICREEYRFGLKMGGERYVTGADPLLIHRISIPRSMTLEDFAALFP